MKYKYCYRCGCYHEHEQKTHKEDHFQNISKQRSRSLGAQAKSVSEISTEELIREEFVDSTRYLLNKDGVIDIYLHSQGGEQVVSEGDPSFMQTISSLKIDNSDINYFKSVVGNLDEQIDLDFSFTSNPNNSDISIYYDSEIDLGYSSKVLGLAIKDSQKNKGWELFLNRPELNSTRYRRYCLIHEFGHSLGLEHPFSDSDGDVVAGITDPYKSSYPEDTVMAYRYPRNGVWPNSFSNNDINSFIAIWGEEKTDEYIFTQADSADDVIRNWFESSSPIKAESKDLSGEKLKIKANIWEDTIIINRISNASHSGDLLQAKQNPAAYDRSVSGKQGSILDGGQGKDILRGLGGWDIIDGNGNDDLIHGGNGRDIIDGGAGADELHGDFGWNTFKSQEDGWSDLIAIKSDQHLSNWWYGKSGNNPNGEKADFIEGLDPIDEIKIIGAETTDLSFAKTTHRGASGIGIYAKGILEAVFTGNNLSVSQLNSITTGDASDLAMNNRLWSYRSNNEAPDLLA